MGLGDPEIYLYQFIFDKIDNNFTNIIQYCIMHGLGVCSKVYNFVENMFYVCSFIHHTAVQIDIKKIKYFLFLNAYTTVFSWGADNSNKIELNSQIHLYKTLK